MENKEKLISEIYKFSKNLNEYQVSDLRLNHSYYINKRELYRNDIGPTSMIIADEELFLLAYSVFFDSLKNKQEVLNTDSVYFNKSFNMKNIPDNFQRGVYKKSSITEKNVLEKYFLNRFYYLEFKIKNKHATRLENPFLRDKELLEIRKAYNKTITFLGKRKYNTFLELYNSDFRIYLNKIFKDDLIYRELKKNLVINSIL